MKISLITTLLSLVENKRIEEEVKALGHDFELIDLKNFGFILKEDSFFIPQLSDLQTDVIIMRGIFNSIKTISVLINNLRGKDVRVFDNNFLEHRYSIDKVTDLIKLSIKGILVPDTAYVRDFSKYQESAEKIGYPVVVKSVRSGKGASVFRVDSKDSLDVLIRQLVDQGKLAKSYIIQEFIPYKYDLRCLIIGENVFIMRRIPKKGEFRANFSLGGSVELHDLDEEGKRLAKYALRAVNMSVGGVDILIDESGKRYILEVNHTAGFVGMEKATGKNIGRLYLEHALKYAV
ncbi:hypothetical protein A2686_03000 [Candidatus Woesebacteria bacterium RIFCSPHIGHO2_01_FULL_38_10]|uniref:ATP-grasp domain-containing protein n=1 Tax=Candidatus Woesebacteria bacterium RIFCSPLOWO2_01_FULL_39_10b TaxID=1802517 RepID=A0A1F8B902_9BACT|nr:MAG: hypothetical protein A2686_03000 [Candidatus Woesebacteria bacterium RIFCSPHIGHO2_01_FULL_38_10]OGM60526.1 MAG: hypothetical protein A2892_00690 [Candidatus Woesebacteria bacterium RIFCSPLOWO2_01_FULL_39_10b]